MIGLESLSKVARLFSFYPTGLPCIRTNWLPWIPDTFQQCATGLFSLVTMSFQSIINNSLKILQINPGRQNATPFSGGPPPPPLVV